MPATSPLRLLRVPYPDVKIGKTRIHTMAYGTQRPDGKYAIGALDLLENPEATLPLGLINTEQVQGDDSQDDTQASEFRHGELISSSIIHPLHGQEQTPVLVTPMFPKLYLETGIKMSPRQ